MTAPEIIRGIRHADDDWDAASAAQVLADRVEVVLAIPFEPVMGDNAEQSWALGYRAALKGVRRILNGESE